MQLRPIREEPLLHFLAIGAALFLHFHWTGGGSGPGATRIVITSGPIEHLVAGSTEVWQRPLWHRPPGAASVRVW